MSLFGKHVFEQRILKIKDELREGEFSGIVLSKAASIIYLSGFSYEPGDRPLNLVIPVDGEPTLIVPELEFLHAREKCPLADVRCWGAFDFPTKTPYLHLLGQVLHEKGLDQKKLGIDEKPSEHLWTTLNKLVPNVQLTAAEDTVARMMLTKSKDEILLLKKISKYVDLLLYALKQNAGVGKDELRIGITSVHRVYERIIKELPEAELDRINPLIWGSIRVGPETAYPHGLGPHNKLRNHETGYLIAIANMFDYTSISTRPTIIGKPTPHQIRMHNAIFEAIEEEREAMKPGVKCSEVYQIAKRAIKKRGFDDNLRGGYSVGLLGTGNPMLSDGEDTELRAGMTFYIVRGIFQPNIGGPRCADTVVVTDSGAQYLTNTPRELETWAVR